MSLVSCATQARRGGRGLFEGVAVVGDPVEGMLSMRSFACLPGHCQVGNTSDLGEGMGRARAGDMISIGLCLKVRASRCSNHLVCRLESQRRMKLALRCLMRWRSCNDPESLFYCRHIALASPCPLLAETRQARCYSIFPGSCSSRCCKGGSAPRPASAGYAADGFRGTESVHSLDSPRFAKSFALWHLS